MADSDRTVQGRNWNIFQALNNVRIRTVGTAVATLLVITAVVIVMTSRFTVQEVGNIGRTWQTFDRGAAAKSDILGHLYRALGYGGMIHDFKNFVLRRGSLRIVTVQEKLFDITASLSAYSAIGVNPRERRALDEIYHMVRRYVDALATAERMAGQGATSREIDAAVKLDDRPALKALEVLAVELRSARNTSAESVYDSVNVVTDFISIAEIVVFVLLGFLIVSFLWLTRSRLARPLAELGGAMEALAHGNHDVGIPGLSRRDEIGAMARTVRVFRNNAIERGRAGAALRDNERILKINIDDLEQAQRRLQQQGEDLTRLAENLRLTRDEAEAANRAKSDFLATMSHELRTPLNAVIGFSEIMTKETFGPVGSPRYLAYAGDIRESGLHLLALINDILDLSKVESGADELCEEAVDIPAVALSVHSMVTGRADKGGVELDFGIPDDLPPLSADMRKLKQILVNLLSNGIKFTEAGGTVSLKVWCRTDSGYVFQVVDSGIGIPFEDIPKALSQFGQVRGDVACQHEGSGLGLPLAKGLVELHGGSLDLQSRVGVGTTVTVRFPAERIIASPAEALPASAQTREAG